MTTRPTKEAQAIRTQHLRALDGLRGYMAVWVWIAHCCVRTGAHIPGLQDNGTPVEVFMFLSGFLMTWNHFQNGTDMPPTAIVSFYVKRFFRISPLYYTVLILSTLALRPWDVTTLKDVGFHATYLFGLFPQTASNNILPDWSLSLEMQFYAVFPLLTILSKRLGDMLVIFGAVILMYVSERFISLPGHPARFEIASYPIASLLTFNLSIFAVGMASAKLVRLGAVASIVGALLASGVALAFHRNLLLPLIVLPIILGVLRLGGPTVRAFAGALSSRAGKILGDLSFSIYLLHMLAIDGALFLFSSGHWLDNMSVYGRFAVLLCATAPIVLFCAAITHRFIERPGIRLGNLMLSRLSLAERLVPLPHL